MRHEFYVIHALNRKETDPLIATLEVGGLVYRMHRDEFSDGGYRFKAVAPQPQDPDHTAKVTIDLAPFLDFWKENGLGDSRYLHEISWAVELLTSEDHEGEVTLRWQ